MKNSENESFEGIKSSFEDSLEFCIFLMKASMVNSFLNTWSKKYLRLKSLIDLNISWIISSNYLMAFKISS
jgi:hypothetical protein